MISLRETERDKERQRGTERETERGRERENESEIIGNIKKGKARKREKK